MKKNQKIKFIFLGLYLLFLLVSFITGYIPGKKIAFNLFSFLLYMLKILPCAFILIGLFEAWVKREHIEKHLGEETGFRGYIWIILLAGTIAGGVIVALPVAYSLYNKGARLSIIFTYIGAAAICRIPMTLFEISFLGIKFSMIRLFVSLPLVIITSIFLERYLITRNYRMIKEE